MDRIDAERGLSALRKNRILDSMIIRLQSDAANYEMAIAAYREAMAAYGSKDSAIAASYSREIGIMASQRTDMETQIHALEKQLRRARTGQRVTAIAGIIAAAGVGYLLVK